jgi:hypothetical protein
MKCKAKDCKECVHFLNIATHPLFKEFQFVRESDGKPLDFEGCVFHLQAMVQLQMWRRMIGVQAAVGRALYTLLRDATKKH